MKKMNKKVNYTLINTNNTPDYEDYVDYCLANDEEPFPEGSTEFWDWVGLTKKDNVECFFDNLQSCIKNNDGACLIIGSLGLWDGTHEIEPVFEWTLEDAIKKCINGSSAEDFSVELDVERGEIIIAAYHHDGTNSFVIKPLTRRGENVAYDKKENGESLSDYKSYWFKKYNFLK